MVWLNAPSDRRVLGRGLTVSMHCIKSSEKMFDSILSKCVVLYPVIVVDSWVFDRDLTKGMHCIIASENLVFDRGLPNIHMEKS